MRERLFVQLSTVVMRIISKSFEVSARKITHNNNNYKIIMIISNSNYCTEWSTIRGVIAEADFKLRARLLSELYNTKSNYKLIITITTFDKNVTVT